MSIEKTSFFANVLRFFSIISTTGVFLLPVLTCFSLVKRSKKAKNAYVCKKSLLKALKITHVWQNQEKQLLKSIFCTPVVFFQELFKKTKSKNAPTGFKFGQKADG